MMKTAFSVRVKMTSGDDVSACGDGACVAFWSHLNPKKKILSDGACDLCVDVLISGDACVFFRNHLRKIFYAFYLFKGSVTMRGIFFYVYACVL